MKKHELRVGMSLKSKNTGEVYEVTALGKRYLLVEIKSEFSSHEFPRRYHEVEDYYEISDNIKVIGPKPSASSDKLSEVKVNFGKHKGLKLEDVPTAYLSWCVQNITDGDKLPLINKMAEYLKLRLGHEEASETHYQYNQDCQQDESEDDRFSFCADDIPF